MPTHKIRQWSYSGKPGSSEKDELRFLIGDTDPSNQQLDDCEVSYLLGKTGSVISAAICAVEGLMAIYARDFTGKFGSSTSSEIFANYKSLYKILKDKRANSASYVAFSGGRSISDKTSRDADTDRVRPVFTMQINENPMAMQPNDRIGTDYGES